MKEVTVTASPTDGYKDVINYLHRIQNLSFDKMVTHYAEIGLDRLRSVTPYYTGYAESSWRYEIENTGSNTTISWHNDDIEGGYSVILLLEYGHGVSGGGYVRGRHFVSPAMDGIFEQLVNEIWEAISA